jgi:hypothetical protein
VCSDFANRSIGFGQIMALDNAHTFAVSMEEEVDGVGGDTSKVHRRRR